VNVTWMNDSACGTMTAANAPCSIRDATKRRRRLAKPHSADAMVKPVIADRVHPPATVEIASRHP